MEYKLKGFELFKYFNLFQNNTVEHIVRYSTYRSQIATENVIIYEQFLFHTKHDCTISAYTINCAIIFF